MSTISVLFLGLCACIQGRYIPWGDEVQFVDPAANLYNHLGFVSRQHSNENDTVFWCGNAPGYTFLLYLAFRTFHFSQGVARWLNDGIMILAICTLWSAVRRTRLLAEAKTRLLMVLFVLTGYSCYTCFANIRYDGLGLLECALVFWLYTYPQPWIRHSCLFVLGASMVFTNLQMPQYILALSLILTYAYSLRWTPLWNLRFLYLGLVSGGAGLIALYASQRGALQAFRINLGQQSGQSVAEKLHDLPYYFQYDVSLAALLVLLLASLVLLRIKPGSRARHSLTAGLLICTVIPAVFFLSRRFVFSSAWMVYVPAVICIGQLLERTVSASRLWKAVVVFCGAVSIGFGLPKAVAGIWTDWDVRNYAVVDHFVAESVDAGDVVLCEPAAYFTVKPRAARVYGPGYLDVMSEQEKRSVSVVITSPQDQAEFLRTLGGHWTATRQLVQDSRSSTQRLLPFSTNFRCDLAVFRRTGR